MHRHAPAPSLRKMAASPCAVIQLTLLGRIRFVLCVSVRMPVNSNVRSTPAGDVPKLVIVVVPVMLTYVPEAVLRSVVAADARSVDLTDRLSAPATAVSALVPPYSMGCLVLKVSAISSSAAFHVADGMTVLGCCGVVPGGRLKTVGPLGIFQNSYFMELSPVLPGPS